MRRPLESRKVVEPEHGGDDDPDFGRRNELGVHDDPRHAPITVCERMHLRHEEREVGSARKRVDHGPADLERLAERVLDQLRQDEQRRASLVRAILEAPRPDLGPRGHHDPVSPQEQFDQFVAIPWRAPHLVLVRDEAVRPLDVVCVLGSLRWNLVIENDGCRLVERELRALDVVREVGLIERQQRPARLIYRERGQRVRWKLAQDVNQLPKPLDPNAIVAAPGSANP